MTTARPKTRIQEKNRATILNAALEVFSQFGFRGATLDQIAREAGLSKPNVLYYFASKDAIHAELLAMQVDKWMEPLAEIDPTGEPIEEILAYVSRKLDMTESMPRESRLFANEILHGAPRVAKVIEGPLKKLVDEKAAVIRGWAEAGRIAPVDPYHLIFSIWATTQHYADFDVQVRRILESGDTPPMDGARRFLSHMYRATLTPPG